MRFNFLFLLALLITGCVSVPATQSPSQLSSNHGYVYVNLPKGQPSDKLMLKSLMDDSQYTLLSRSDSDVHALGLWLPAGEYKLFKWDDSNLDGYPPLKVEVGRLTDLGSFIPIQIGGYEFVVLPVRPPEFSKNVDIPINEYKAFLKSKETIEWKPEKTPNPTKSQFNAAGYGIVVELLLEYERHANKPSINKQLRGATSIQDFFRLAKMAAPPLTKESGRDAAGRIYYGADLGQIRVRKPVGEWDAIDTGTLNSVTAVEVSGAMIVAGFENGVIKVSENAGVTWKEIVSLGRNTSVLDIDRVGGDWIILATRKATDNRSLKGIEQIVVYRAKRNDFKDITNIKQIEIKAPIYFVPHGEAVNDYYYVSSFPDLLRLNVVTSEWKTVTPPTDVSGFHVSPTTGVIAAYRIMGAFSKLFVSTDQGESWSKYDNPPYVIMDIHFKSKTDGEATRWSMGAFSGNIELLKYNNLQDSWSKTGEAPHGCGRLLIDVSNMGKFCITTAGSILKFVDRNWVAEFAVD